MKADNSPSYSWRHLLAVLGLLVMVSDAAAQQCTCPSGADDDGPASSFNSRLAAAGGGAAADPGSGQLEGGGLAGLIGRSWNDLHQLLLSFIEKGGDVWEIPPLPRLLLMLLLGQPQGEESDDWNGTRTEEGTLCEEEGVDIATQSGDSWKFVPAAMIRGLGYLMGKLPAPPRLSVEHHLDVIRDRGEYLNRNYNNGK